MGMKPFRSLVVVLLVGAMGLPFWISTTGIALGQYAVNGSSGGFGAGSGSPPNRLGGSKLNREPGAIYLEEILAKPIKLKVVCETPVYLQLDGKRNIGTLIADREVELLAISDKAYRVKGRAKHDQVAGWIRPSDVDGLTDSLKDNLKKVYERAIIVEDLIHQNQIALGMTLDEVVRSLGNPTRTSSALDKDGRKDTFEYITYDTVAQQGPLQFGVNGQYYSSVTHIKVETGKVSIKFENEQVTSIEESEGSSSTGGGVRIVPSPIVLY